jgi:hypothetical protein
MSDERTKAAMQWVAEAMGNGFSGEESYKVNEDSGKIVIWLNDQPAGYTRLSFGLGSISTVTPEQFFDEYIDEERVTVLYITRLKEIGPTMGPIGRFYAFLDDEILYNLDQQGRPDYDALCALYREWLGEMSVAERIALSQSNDERNSANMNHLLPELLAEDGTIW